MDNNMAYVRNSDNDVGKLNVSMHKLGHEILDIDSAWVINWILSLVFIFTGLFS